MTVAAPILTARTLILAKIESTYNTDANPVPANDAFLVSEADVSVDPNVLERNNFRPSLSPTAVSIGRKLVNVTFTHELKGSGTFGSSSKIGTLLRGCGFSETSYPKTAAAAISTPVAGSANTGATVAWSKDVMPTSRYGTYNVTVVTAGASATAAVMVHGNPHHEGDTSICKSLDFSVVSNGSTAGTIAVDTTDLTAPFFTFGGTWVEGDAVTLSVGGVEFSFTAPATPTATTVGDAAVTAITADTRFTGTANSLGTVTIDFAGNAAEIVLTSGTTAVTLGNSIGEITPTWTGNLDAGDTWSVVLNRPGLHYDPVSTGFESLTIYVYFDGLLHKVTGCMGSVSFSGEAGNFGTASFTFTGQYVAPEDASLPSGAVYESSIPSQIELAALVFDDLREVCAQSFSADMNNEVTARDCMNGSDGFNGVQITGRNPQGGVNPEATQEANHPFWNRFANATQAKFHVNVGTVEGNIIHFVSESVQYSGISYTDRNGTRVYDVSLRFSAATADGDDELKLIFS